MELPNLLKSTINEICLFKAVYSKGVDLLISKILGFKPFYNRNVKLFSPVYYLYHYGSP